MTHRKFLITSIIGTALLTSLPLTSQANTNVCTNLPTDLAIGATNSSSNNMVGMLQTFLINEGFLVTTSIGRFGPATEEAVIRFQRANSLSASGFVGPLTRALIKSRTCTTPTTPAPSTPVSTPAPTTQTPSQTIAPGYVVTYPTAGRSFTLGDQTTISWTGPKDQSVDITLEDQNGVGQGYIASGLYNITQYTWKVGEIFSGDKKTISGPGTYRIRVRSSSRGIQAGDRTSVAIGINATPLYIRNLLPGSSMPNDGKTTGVIYGTGFNNTSAIKIDGEWGMAISPTYLSPDGRVLVFTIPSYIGPGNHTISVKNNYLTASTSPSNALDLVVTSSN